MRRLPAPLTLCLALLSLCAFLAPTAAEAASGHSSARGEEGQAHRHRGHHGDARKSHRHRAAQKHRKRHARKPGLQNARRVGGKASKAGPAVPALPSAPTPISPVAPESEGRVIFGGGFDGSFSPWYVQSLPYRATINSAHPETGSGAGRFEVQPGDREPDTGGQRSEVSGPTFREGQNVYIRDDIRVPYGYTYQGSWQLIDQLHESDWGGSPGTATFLDPNRKITFATGTNSIQFWRGPQLEFERWYDLVFRINFSQNPNEGYVEVWWNGVQQTLTNGQTRLYAKTIQMPETYLKAGVFRSSDSSGISIVEHDNVVVGTTLASVMNN